MDINYLFRKYYSFVENISYKYNYDNNIKHLLSVVIPLFINRYGYEYETLIKKCFSETKIIYNDKKDDFQSGYFARKLIKENNEYKTYKFIVINSLQKDNYIDLLDTFIHEFNHILNSINNEIMITNENILVRTGLSYIKYNINNIINPIGKTEEFVLEEIINSKETSNIINAIFEINLVDLNDEELKNFIEVIKKEIQSKKFESKAYYLESKICETLLNNKTFMSTLLKLRISGNVVDIENWFDDFTFKGAYKKFNLLLFNLFNYDYKCARKNKINFIDKYIIKKYINDIRYLITNFNNNSVYK